MATLNREKIGLVLGYALAPLTGLGSWLRHSRLFHPEGTVYLAEVTPIPSQSEAHALAGRLRGKAWVRLSTAWWKSGKEWIDALGCAIRFFGESQPDQTQPRQGEPVAPPGSQDLLFATIRSPWTTLLAPASTEQHDFLNNDYFAVAPFEAKGLGRVKFRLRAPKHSFKGKTRGEKLARAVEKGIARLRLEYRPLKLRDRPENWFPLCEVRLLHSIEIDQEALRFSPFRSGLGIQPRGLVNLLRVGTYRASQSTRPAKTSS